MFAQDLWTSPARRAFKLNRPEFWRGPRSAFRTGHDCTGHRSYRYFGRMHGLIFFTDCLSLWTELTLRSLFSISDSKHIVYKSAYISCAKRFDAIL